MEKDEFLSGEKLYGDDFTESEILNWYKEEEEGYASLPSTELDLLKKGVYLYENLNSLHALDHIPANTRFEKVLGIGSATGDEFLPIIHRINDITILEPSDNFVQSSKIKNKITYRKPDVSGKIPFEDNTFDLITCFGVLHHIANVSDVFREIKRVLKPGGLFIFREPIISMGDWRFARPGLTKNERGLPLAFIEKKILENNFEIVHESLCLTGTSFINKLLSPVLKYPLVYYKGYLHFDKRISYILRNKVKYHCENKYKRIYPSAKYYIIKKGQVGDTAQA